MILYDGKKCFVLIDKKKKQEQLRADDVYFLGIEYELLYVN